MLPRPTALLVQAGNTQQGPVGAALAQPTNTLVAQSLASPVTVAARDAGGNPVTGFTGNVTLAVGANPGGATLGGTVTVAAVAGIATFANLTLSAPGTGYTLAASSGALTGATSSSFNITSAAAPSLQFGVHPLTSTVAGTPLAPALTVTARDAGGSIVTAFTGTGTFATVNATPPLSALPSYSGGAVTIGGGTGTLRIASGATLTLESGGTGAGLAVLNQGTLVLRASNDINGPLTNSAGATLRVQ